MSAIVRDQSLPFVQARRRSDGEPLSLVATLSEATDLSRLQVALEVIPPGHRSSPPHQHSRTEEAVYVLAGTPTLHLGARTTQLHPGDFVGLAAGGPPHFIENRSSEPAELLSMRAPTEGDVVSFDR